MTPQKAFWVAKLFPAWFISSVTARGLGEAVGICRLQTRGPACSPTSWKGTVRHGPEGLRSRAPHGQSRERATSPDAHVGFEVLKHLRPPDPHASLAPRLILTAGASWGGEGGSAT